MEVRKLATVLTLCIVVCILFCWITETAFAQGKEDAIKDLSAKKGLDVLNSGKKSDEDKSPTKLQKILGIGSVFVAVAVVKWL